MKLVSFERHPYKGQYEIGEFWKAPFCTLINYLSFDSVSYHIWFPQYASGLHDISIRKWLGFSVCSKYNLKSDLVFQVCKLLIEKTWNFRGSNHFLSLWIWCWNIKMYAINTDKLYLEERNHIFEKIPTKYLITTY